MKTTILTISNPISDSLVRCALILIPFVLICVATLPGAHAVSPPPDGGYPGFNTAEGQNALFSLTTGAANTAVGFRSLFSDTEGSFNTAIGAGALLFNTAGENTAFGAAALLFNTTGMDNTAVGAAALSNNTLGQFNTAVGHRALDLNITGDSNTAVGESALLSNTGGGFNTATGFEALFNNTGNGNTANGFNALATNSIGSFSTATGFGALFNNITGNGNTANGDDALVNNTTGSDNIAMGRGAGSNLTTGDLNIDIGAFGVAGESATIRIGRDADQTRTFIAGITGVAVTGTPVVVDGSGQLGVAPSSRRFKKEIKPMDKASDAILALKPVTFHYKSDSTNTPQFGLIAEDVAAVNPDLVVCDENGEIYTVRYEAVNAMLLNEFLKEHREVAGLKSTVAEQRKSMEAMAAQLKEQAAQIQKVSAQIEARKPAPQVVNNP